MAGEVYLPARLGDLEVLALIDSGNSLGCLISRRLALKLDLKIEEMKSKAAGGAGNSIKIDGVV